MNSDSSVGESAVSLHMLQLSLDARGLATLGKMLHLPLAQTSTNYLVHCALGELFGDDAPKPFFVDDDPRSAAETAEASRRVRVLGYAQTPGDALQQAAKLDASPTVYEICDWDRFAAKPMPDSFPEGMDLRFELRACPVVRKSSAGSGTAQNGDPRSWKAGEELDVFLSEAWENPDEDLSREGVYRNWLEDHLDHRGGAEVDEGSVQMTGFSIERMTRRTHRNGNGDRTVKTLKRPDVTLTGRLTVTDSDAFPNLLRSGIGRHKSFGYGMLKVRR